MPATTPLPGLPAVPPFVGREAPLERLGSPAEFPGSERRSIVVCGDVGIGKTRLVQEWLDRSPSCHGLIVRAPQPYVAPGLMLSELILAWMEKQPGEADASKKLARLIDELSERFIELPCGQDLRAGAPFLLRAIGGEPESEQERSLAKHGYFGELVASLRGLLGCIARSAAASGARLVLVLDDADMADRSSTALFRRALAGLAPEEMPRLICTAVDSDTVQRALLSADFDVETISLDPFSDEEQSLFLSRMLDGFALPERLAESLLRRSLGSPLALDQQVRLLVAQKTLRPDTKDGWKLRKGVETAVSTKDVVGVIAENLRELPGPALQAVVAAGTLGLRASRKSLHSVIEELGGDTSELNRYFVQLIKKGFLFPLSSPKADWVFRHPSIRDACDRIMPAEAQRDLHRAAGNALAGSVDDNPQLFAGVALHHALAAGRRPQAFAYAAQASDDAIRRGMYAGVVDIANVVVPYFDEFDDNKATACDKTRLLLNLARASMKMGRPGKAVEALNALPDLRLITPDLHHRLLCEAADVHAVTGEFAGIAAQASKALQEVEPTGLKHAELCFAMSLVLRRRGDLVRARECLADAREVFLAHGRADRAVDCLHQAAGIYRQETRLDEAEMLIQEALDILGRSPDRADYAGSLVTLATIQSHRGNQKAARETFQQALEILDSIGDGGKADVCRANMGNIDYVQGRTEEALESYRKVLESARKREQPNTEAYARLNLGIVALGAEQWQEAAEHLRAALKLARETGLGVILPCVATLLSQSLLDAGKFQEAEEAVSEALALTREHRVPDCEALVLALQGDLLAKTGRLAQGAEAFDEAVHRFDEFEAAGRTSEVLARGDILLRLGRIVLAFAKEWPGEFSGGKAAPAYAEDLLRQARGEFESLVARGFLVRERDIGRVDALLASLAR